MLMQELAQERLSVAVVAMAAINQRFDGPKTT